jgi:dienelactone hydrolase
VASATRTLFYHDREIALTGVLASDDARRDKRPGILLAHGGAGLDDHAKAQARRYAALGYVVFACDMYGDGVAGNRERVLACIDELRSDQGRMARRARAGLAVLAGWPEADGRFAAIGFCFGGMAVLELARAGEDLAGVVSIHGSLSTARPAEPDSIRARILVCHGASDPHVPLASVVAFAQEMNHARADWQLNMYGNAVHGFTHEHTPAGATSGVAYDARADRRSFADVRAFLAQVLPDTPGA